MRIYRIKNTEDDDDCFYCENPVIIDALRLEENLPQFFSGRKYVGLILKLFSRWRPPWAACRNNV